MARGLDAWVLLHFSSSRCTFWARTCSPCFSLRVALRVRVRFMFLLARMVILLKRSCSCSSSTRRWVSVPPCAFPYTMNSTSPKMMRNWMREVKRKMYLM